MLNSEESAVIEVPLQPRLSAPDRQFAWLSHERLEDDLFVRRVQRFFLFIAITPLAAYVVRNVAFEVTGIRGAGWLSWTEFVDMCAVCIAILGLGLGWWFKNRPDILRWIEPFVTITLMATYLVMARIDPVGVDSREEALATMVAMSVLFIRALLVPSRPRVTFSVGVAVLVLVFLFLAVEPGHASSERVMDMVQWATWGVPTVIATTLATTSLQELRHRDRVASALGSYVLEAEIGRGGMGTVYRARHGFLKMHAAVKVLDSTDPVFVRRFLREAEALSELSHPHTVRLFDYGTTDANQPYFVMEHLNGVDLQRLVDERGPMSEASACRVIAQVASALGEAHRHGIVHRDIKPSNIFFLEEPDGPVLPEGCYVKVVDFGLARRLASTRADTQQSAVHTVAGTPLYMAPEQIDDPDRVDPSADIYALGCVFFFLLTGRPLVNGQNALRVMAEHLTRPVSELLESAPRIPSALRRIIQECVAKRPTDRWESVHAMLDAIQRAGYVSMPSTIRQHSSTTERDIAFGRSLS
ncbi:MAG: serine/threonine-protein kinase [Myxococcota bacterium]